MKDPTHGHELHPKPQDVLTGGEPEAQRGTGSIPSHTANNGNVARIESRFCAGHGSQCCVWIFSFNPYQIRTLIDEGTRQHRNGIAVYGRLQR